MRLARAPWRCWPRLVGSQSVGLLQRVPQLLHGAGQGADFVASAGRRNSKS